MRGESRLNLTPAKDGLDQFILFHNIRTGKQSRKGMSDLA
jgi:hypothetical protein